MSLTIPRTVGANYLIIPLEVINLNLDNMRINNNVGAK
jgi:hypothetical protein